MAATAAAAVAPSLPSTSDSTSNGPNKRRRLAANAQPSISTRKMDDLSTSLEVDHMILDCLLYHAVEACLNHPHTFWDDSHPSLVERTLLQADEFYALFRKRYPTYKLDAATQFRRDLLQFAALFTQRLRRNSTTPERASLKRLREFNRARAYCWIGDILRQPTADYECSVLDTKLPLPHEELERNRARVLQQLGVPAEDDAYEDAFYGMSESTSLLDLLPLFMKVSAACFAIFDVGLTTQWITMATALMLHAVVEQYTVYGEDGSDAIDEAFAWGYKGKLDEADDVKINNMFEDEDQGREVPEWQTAKGAALQVIFAYEDDEVFNSEKQPDASEEERLVPHLGELLHGQSTLNCEKMVMAFLRDISQGIAKPVLLQLEQGKLDGMTQEETRSFVSECGLDVERFLLREW